MPYFRTTTVTTTSTDRGYVAWCCSRLAVLKWLQAIFCLIILVLVQPSEHCWDGYKYMFIMSIVLLIATLVTIIVYFLRLHTMLFPDCPWHRIEFLFSLAGFILFLVAFGLGIWDCIEIHDGDHGHHDHRFGCEPGNWKARMVAVTVLSGFNMLFYLSSALHANHFHVL